MVRSLSEYYTDSNRDALIDSIDDEIVELQCKLYEYNDTNPEIARVMEQKIKDLQKKKGNIDLLNVQEKERRIMRKEKNYMDRTVNVDYFEVNKTKESAANLDQRMYALSQMKRVQNIGIHETIKESTESDLLISSETQETNTKSLPELEDINFETETLPLVDKNGQVKQRPKIVIQE